MSLFAGFHVAEQFGTKLDYTYITPRVVAMPFPQDPSSKRRVDGSNPIHAIADYLNAKHGGHYMIWNVSEESYDYSLFNDQVLEYKVNLHDTRTTNHCILVKMDNDMRLCAVSRPSCSTTWLTFQDLH